MQEYPFVSVVIPVRNEAAYIRDCLEALLDQTYPKDRYEIIIVDGMSEDSTRQVIKSVMSNRNNIKLLDNLRQTTPAALNLGIGSTKGELIARVDGHTIVGRDYLRVSVETLNRTKADCVGGPTRTSGKKGYTWNAVAKALTSGFAVADSRSHYAEKEFWAESVTMPLFPRETFQKFGVFDEEFLRNQDEELSYRIRERGGKIFCCPSIEYVYYPRKNLIALCKQYFQYGYWKVRVWQKHPDMMRTRHFIPSIFVIALAIGAVGGFLFKPARIGFLAIVSAYFLASLVFSLSIARNKIADLKYMPILLFVFASIHLGYGLGFLVGLFKFRNRWASP